LAMVEMFDDPKQNRGFRSCPKWTNIQQYEIPLFQMKKVNIGHFIL
jgi:hypothetical protein